MSAVPQLRVVEPADIVFDVDEGYPLVPDGHYKAICIGCDIKFVFKSLKAFLRFRISEGEYAGTVLWRAYGVSGKIIPGKGPGSGPRPKLKRKSKLFKMLARVLNLPHNTRTHHVRSRDLVGKLCWIKTRTVVSDHEQNKLSEAEKYSVVEDVIELIAG